MIGDGERLLGTRGLFVAGIMAVLGRDVISIEILSFSRGMMHEDS